MPKKILASQRTKFWRLYKEGHTIVEAAKRAGFSESYGKGLVREGKGDNSTPGSRPQRFAEEQEDAKPKARDELSDVARDCLSDFERFRARYLGSVSTPWQVEAGQRAVELLETPDKEYVVINCPQGGGKTRLFSHDLTAWVTVRNRAIRGIFGSLSQSVSTNLCANLRDTLERTAPARAREEDLARGLAQDAEATLAADYGRFKPEGSGGLWRREGMIVEQLLGASMEKEPTWAAFSREAKFLGWRVDMMVWDDLVNTDMLRNQDRVEDLYRWWDDEAQSRIDPGGLVLLVGQRLRSNDIYRYCLDKRVVVDEYDDDSDVRPMYHHFVYKAHYDEKCTGEHTKNMPPWPDSCMLDAQRITPRDIQEKKADGNYEVVYQQQDTDPSNVLVKKEWVNGGVIDGATFEGCWDDNRAVGQVPPFVVPGATTLRYMTVDPSPTKWWAIMDWLYVLPRDGTERLAGYRYLIDLHRRKRFGANELLDWAKDQNAYVGVAEDWLQRSKKQGYPITHMIVEKNVAQRFMMQVDAWTTWGRSRGVQIIGHETTTNKSDPDYGVWATLPNAYQYGRVRLPGDKATMSRQAVWPLVQEVTTYPDGSTDDCVMSQWFGEYNLQNLVAGATKVGTIWTDRPSWIRGAA
jgi:hypothetical protein